MRYFLVVLAAVSLGLVLPDPGRAQPPAQDPEPAAESIAPLVKAGEVDGRVVYESQVERELRKVAGDRKIAPELENRLRQNILELLLNRQRILAYLDDQGSGPSEDDLQLELSRFEKQLMDRGVSLPQYLRNVGMHQEELKDEIQWRLAWKSLLDKFLTEANMAAYFDSHRADFDGRRLKVAHILWKDKGDPAEVATRVRKQIEAGEIRFEQAAAEYSQAPSASKGGEIGWIERHDPMPESFSKVAFALDENEIGGPVTTSFGIHLIQCLAIEPGTRTWQECRRELADAMARELFDWAVEQSKKPRP